MPKLVDEKWILFSLQMPPTMKYLIEDKSYKLKLKQSELVRQAVDDFLLLHADTEQEKEAAELVSRQRKERLGLMKPKDGYKTEMLVAGAWHTIKNARAEYVDMGILAPFHYDFWIQRLRENIGSLEEDNPNYEVAKRSFLLLIERLEIERNESFPEGD